MNAPRVASPLSLLLLVAIPVPPATARPAALPPKAYGRIELIRDRWGIPHVFADTDEGAMYGLGYACAEERGFQMVHSLRIIQGRLAELIGDAPKLRRRETAVSNDRKMRTFGFYRAAKRVAANLDAETLALLRAYCRGVNDGFAANRGTRHPLFAKLDVEPEPWTPADCIVSWWHLAQFFATDGTRDLLSWRNLTGAAPAGRPGRGPRPKPGPLWIDEEAAVVQRADVSDEWVRRVEAFCGRHLPPATTRPATGPGGPKFSHAWVVGGRKTTTGSAVLVSDPQTPVRNPSLWHEFHIRGKTFNARGVGVPGSPGLLIGFHEHVAWGATALGADQADLFRLKTDRRRPNEYFFDGAWHKMTVRRETIRVRGARPVEITVRETRFGPVVTPFAFARPGDPEVALKRVPVCQDDTETIQGLIAMLRARSARQFGQALAGWHFPSCNVIFGDREGHVGYWLTAAVPIRSAREPHHGRAAMDGTRSDHDWQGFVPHNLKPHVIDPKRGWIASGNHSPVGTFYRIPLGIVTGAAGHSIRSWRLYERLEARQRFKPADVLDIHYDCVNPARRDIVRIGYHLRDVRKRELSPEALRALKHLEPWYRAGAKSDLTVPGAETAVELSTFFRFMATRLALKYGGGNSGLARFLRDTGRRLAADPKAPIEPLAREFVDHALATAWRSSQRKYGPEPSAWPQRARAQVRRQRLGWFVSLDGFGTLDAGGDLGHPALACVDAGTIRSQGGQSYTQYVPLHDVDASLSVLPPGHGDRAADPHRTSTMDLWATGKLHPAPLSRKAVEKIAATTRVLSK